MRVKIVGIMEGFVKDGREAMAGMGRSGDSSYINETFPQANCFSMS